ncbi:hypothetical protein SKAU_G00324240 [Synaphobranchus kaupii]|uniref:Uncharacterized protein n=1 Tax=Synaphobranchus kaupii TaxID=118154 RepID=A0A9Q1IK33_SYNKA|nr:hypothetical protein SKAU_G00324240 [Synaphobranchus kaupii]
MLRSSPGFSACSSTSGSLSPTAGAGGRGPPLPLTDDAGRHYCTRLSPADASFPVIKGEMALREHVLMFRLDAAGGGEGEELQLGLPGLRFCVLIHPLYH